MAARACLCRKVLWAAWECLSWRGCGRPGRATSAPVGHRSSSGVFFDNVRGVWRSLSVLWQRQVFGFLACNRTLAAALGLKPKTSAELLDFGAASLTVNS